MSTQKNNADLKLTAEFFNNKDYQLQRKNHFEISFAENSQGQKFIDEGLKFMLVSFPLPKETTDASDINYFNQTIKVAGRTTFETTTMILRDAISYDTEAKFLNWRKKVYDPETGKMGVAADYKIKATVKEFTPNGGGHKRAAGFRIDELSIPKINEIITKYLEALKTGD